MSYAQAGVITSTFQLVAVAALYLLLIATRTIIVLTELMFIPCLGELGVLAKQIT